MKIVNGIWQLVLSLLIVGVLVSCGKSSKNFLDSGDDSSADLFNFDDLPLCKQPDSTAVCFIAIGDVGKGNNGQYDVAAAIEDKCAVDGCHFSLHLGDNFYPKGVKSVDDPQWETKFEAPYANLFFPFYVVLGNHDYGKLGKDFRQGDYQIAYSKVSSKWTLPSRYYDYMKQDVHFFALDSAKAFWKKSAVKEQTKWIQRGVKEQDATWRVAFAHHPYLSNGPHGNAGSYEDLPAAPIVNGKNIKKLVDRAICKDFDIYISGHDHSLQVLEGPSHCPLLFVVSGAGASTTDIESRNEALFAEKELGFAYFIIDGGRLHLQMIGADGSVLYELNLQK